MITLMCKVSGDRKLSFGEHNGWKKKKKKGYHKVRSPIVLFFFFFFLMNTYCYGIVMSLYNA